MTRALTDVEIQKLQSELARLRREENQIEEIINLVKSQLSAVQVRCLCSGSVPDLYMDPD
jgi:cell division protein FtsB